MELVHPDKMMNKQWYPDAKQMTCFCIIKNWFAWNESFVEIMFLHPRN